MGGDHELPHVQREGDDRVLPGLPLWGRPRGREAPAELGRVSLQMHRKPLAACNLRVHVAGREGAETIGRRAIFPSLIHLSAGGFSSGACAASDAHVERFCSVISACSPPTYTA